MTSKVGRKQEANHGRRFDDLYREHYSSVRRLCVHRVTDRGRAEELTQETFVRLWRSIDSLDADRDPRPFIFQIAHNACIDYLRKREVESVITNTDRIPEHATSAWHQPDICLDIADAVEKSEERARIGHRVVAALRGLRERDRELLLLHTQGFSYEEISSMTGDSIHAVRNVTWRARRSLRNVLSDLEHASYGIGAMTVWLRRSFARVQRGFARISSEFPASAETLCSFACIVILTLGVTGPFPRSTHGVPQPKGSSIASTTERARPASKASGERRVKLQKPTRDPRGTTIEVGPTRPGGVAPSDATMKIVVYGPDGQPIFWTDSGTACSPGQQQLPEESPVRSSC